MVILDSWVDVWILRLKVPPRQIYHGCKPMELFDRLVFYLFIYFLYFSFPLHGYSPTRFSNIYLRECRNNQAVAIEYFCHGIALIKKSHNHLYKTVLKNRKWTTLSFFLFFFVYFRTFIHLCGCNVCVCSRELLFIFIFGF